MSGDNELDWLYEAIIRFLQGPCYSAPLMSFIDENCVIFDNEEENKIEYTDIHEKFKTLVDQLLTEFLEELGVPVDTLVNAVSEASHEKLNSFVLTSILTVDDFLQFKAMMVKRNVDLTEEVLRHLANGGGPVPPPEGVELDEREQNAVATPAAEGGAASAPGLSAEEEEDIELMEALRLSQETYSLEQAEDLSPEEAMKLVDQRVAEQSGEDAEMAGILSASMSETVRLEQERAELEQAIALSVALQQEQERLIEEVLAHEKRAKEESFAEAKAAGIEIPPSPIKGGAAPAAAPAAAPVAAA
eukprot:CAMPEP_0182909292 /NCGR_PEP_ID=MMETSP0034_2-20130328/35674_1 /TAXON_ID=156128 /ORGANISM="Nephroselmis pyriformis, Strain CCMP717" /LENGTH=302 /DNA_ID=CAMNT_0025045537 /DNA_START=89 /DNA_END=993 /DNA_ORIENTATION=+